MSQPPQLSTNTWPGDRGERSAVSRRKSILLAGLLGVWAMTIAVGMVALNRYSGSAGGDLDLIAAWPDQTDLVRDQENLSLFIFIHPKCPCSRATLNQLARALVANQKPLKIQTVVFCPFNIDPDWTQTDLTRLAEKISTNPSQLDWDGEEASRFGVSISGHIILYDAKGTRLFSGGITAGRGHEGSNVGYRSLCDLIQGNPVSHSRFPVFGCQILAENDPYGERSPQ